jgi:Asp/Glu/hydantoin racemase
VVTGLLHRAALRRAPPDCEIVTRSVGAGPEALRNAADLAVAAQEVLAVARTATGLDGLVIAAFGDPGLVAARQAAPFPVVGLGASGLHAAAGHGRFAILTLGPQMDGPLRARLHGLGLAAQLAGLRYLDADIPGVAADPDRFLPAIAEEARRAAADGAHALLLGGAPFAGLGVRVASCIPVIDGLNAAIDCLLAGDRVVTGS